MSSTRFHPPQQARSQETLDRILDAAEAALEEKSFSETTLAEIMERAGVTVGAFYRRFPDKDALLHHLDERFWRDMHQLADERLDPARYAGRSIPDIVPEFTALAVRVYRERRGLLRGLFLRSRTDRVLRESAREVNGHLMRRLRDLLLERRAEIRHPEPAAAIELGFIVLIGALRETILFGGVWPNLDQPLGDERLARELARLFLGYLGVAGPEGERA